MFKTPLLSLLAASLLPSLIPGTAPTGLQLASPEQLRAIPLASMPYSGVDLPSKVDLSENMPPPGDQGGQNSCVGWATAYVLKSYQERVEHNHILAKPDGSPQWQKVFSPAFVYNLLNNSRDGGITYIDALNLLSSQGVVPWSDMPYNPDDFRSKPAPALLQKARAWRIDYWRQVNVLDPKELKAHLNAGYPVMLGAVIDQGFYRARKGHVWKKREGKSLGGHALVLVGYDDAKRSFKVINSWGPRWADGGYGQIDYAWFARVVREGFVAKDAINGLPTLAQPTQPSTPNRSSSSPDAWGRRLQGGEDLDDGAVEEEQMLVDQLKPVPLLSTIPAEPSTAPPKPDRPSDTAPGPQGPADSLSLKGKLALPVGLGQSEGRNEGKNAQLLLRVYAQEGTRRGPLLSTHLVRQFSGYTSLNALAQLPIQAKMTETNWLADLALNNLNLERHPGLGSSQPLALEIVPELFVDGFGVWVGAPILQHLPTGSYALPKRNAADITAAFLSAWQTQDDGQLWFLLSRQAQREVIDYLSKTHTDPVFSSSQWQTLLENGHPLIREWLWSQLALRSEFKAEADKLSGGMANQNVLPKPGAQKKIQPKLPLIPSGTSWKIQTLKHLLPND
ncbi:MAG: C1 family peptidase [Candidatus Sericytochromatia bacterium]